MRRQLFQLFNIEQKGDSDVFIYGKQLSPEYAPMQTIRITGIFSPVYFLPSDLAKFEKDLYAHTSAIKHIEHVHRHNMFHKNVPRELQLLRVSFTSKVSFEDFINLSGQLESSEKCHVCIIIMETKKKIELLYLSKAVN